MVALREVLTPLKFKRLKLSKFTWITILIAAILGISIATAGYYYYVLPQPTRLRILYIHPDPMVSEVVNDFKNRYGSPIEVTLTPTDPQSAYETITSPSERGKADILWGGPLSLYEEASDNLLPYDSKQKNEINTTLHSCPLMDPDSSAPRWYAASLHALGVMYNEYVLNALNLSIPQTWADLLKEGYEENVTMVDPTESEFTQPFIMLQIQSKNWIRGWEYLVNMSAFVKDYDDTETYSVSKVASGYLSVAIVPDFYAYDKMAYGGYPVNFTYLNATVLQPDPIAIVKSGKYLDEAKAFIDYILTPPAQTIIGQYRLPVHENATVTPPRINPSDQNFPYVPNYNGTFEEIGKEIVKDYYRVWITERHEQEPSIKTAWKEIKEANKTSPYYDLAWNNFTKAGCYTSRAEIDTIYSVTNGWTKTDDVTSYYMDIWGKASEDAYKNAIYNAKETKKQT